MPGRLAGYDGTVPLRSPVQFRSLQSIGAGVGLTSRANGVPLYTDAGPPLRTDTPGHDVLTGRAHRAWVSL